MSLDNALWLFGVVTEVAVVGLLVYRRVWRTLPIFFAYCAWELFGAAVAYPIIRFFPHIYFAVYLAQIVVESALELGILVELTWSVLRPFRASLPRPALVVISGLILALGAAVWPFATIPGFGNYPSQWHLLMRLGQTTSILRVLLFLVLAGCSQLLSIGWRDRELQIASGLGFYSLVGLVVAMLRTHLTTQPQYALLDQVEVAGYLASLLYWVYSFSHAEAKRREFSPQMQGFLLALAGSARTTRIALTDSSIAKRDDRNQP
jgi:hypothetical protein